MGVNMDILLTTVTDFLLIGEILIICNKYLHMRSRTIRYKYLLTLLIIILSSTIINVITNTNITLIIYFLCVWIILLINFIEKKSKLIISELWIILIVEIVNMFLLSLVDTISMIINVSYIYLENLIASLLALIIIYLVGLLLNKFSNRGIQNVQIKYLVGFSLILIADFIILMIMTNITLNEIAFKHKILYMICLTIVVIGLIIQLVAVLSLIVSRDNAREKELVISQYLDEQISHYEYLNQREHETKKFRHDLKNHLHMLQVYINHKDYIGLDKYLDLINENVDNFTKRISVNNDIVDAVINKYYIEALNKNIIVNVDGHFPEQCNVNPYDLCTIFSNLLSNALEASIDSVEKKINISCQYDDENIIVSISNYYSGTSKYENGQFLTSKKNKRIHGFGLENVECCITKNNGYLMINNKNNIFSVTALLKNI